MSIREQILQEIDCEIENQKEICADIVNTSGWRVYQKAMEKAKDIVRKYLPESNGMISIDDRRLWDILHDEACVEGQQAERIYHRIKEICGDGWIPVEKEIPEQHKEFLMDRFMGRE